MKLKFTFLSLCSMLCSFIGYTQNTRIIVGSSINLPADSALKESLLSSLNSFWMLKDSANDQNQFVDTAYYLETSALIDEMKGIENSTQRKDEAFYKTYLTNAVLLTGQKYLIQLSCIGVAEGQPLFRASFELMAEHKGSSFVFYSPLRERTNTWKTAKSGSFTVHFKTDAAMHNIRNYITAASAFDTKLQNSIKVQKQQQHTELFLCSNFPEVLELLGVDYKSSYNGYAFSSLGSQTANKLLLVKGEAYFSRFDPHDLWHDRRRTVYPNTIVNNPVDEGCAYLYGGSWGIPWKAILDTFKKKLASNPATDWLALYDSLYNFGGNPKKSLIASYVINALIIQRLEKQKGFVTVVPLLTCGKYEKGNVNYFAALEKLTGINRQNFNEQIWVLIKASSS